MFFLCLGYPFYILFSPFWRNFGIKNEKKRHQFIKKITWNIHNIFKGRIEARKKEMDERKTQIEQLEKEKSAIEDEVFAGFCVRVGIHNIREYEQRKIPIHRTSAANRLTWAGAGTNWRRGEWMIELWALSRLGACWKHLFLLFDVN